MAEISSWLAFPFPPPSRIVFVVSSSRRRCVTNERFVPIVDKQDRISVYNFIRQFTAIYFARISFVRAELRKLNLFLVRGSERKC